MLKIGTVIKMDAKKVHISSKILSIQCLWIKQLCDNILQNRKVIPIHLVKVKLNENFFALFKATFSQILYTSIQQLVTKLR